MFKKIISTLLIVVFLFSLAGCARFTKKQTPSEETPNEQNYDAATADSSQTAKQFVFNVPEKSFEKNLKVTGQVASFYRLYINDKEFVVGPEGNFNAEVGLVPGINILTFKVVSSDGASIYTTSKTVEYDQKPKLEIKQPSQIAGKMITIEGVTDPDCVVNVNGYKTQSDNNGNFKIDIPSPEGNETVKIVTTNKSGKSTVIQKTITENSLQNSLLQ